MRGLLRESASCSELRHMRNAAHPTHPRRWLAFI